MTWACDVPISMPEPLRQPGLVPMYGFTFTIDGLWHDMSQADYENYKTPTYAPIYSRAYETVEHNTDGG